MDFFVQDALEVQAPDIAEKFVKNLCLFYCYSYCCGITYDTALAAWNEAERQRLNGCLDIDGTVLDADKLINKLTGRFVRVNKKDITDIKDIKEATPVRFDYNKNQHWVVVQNGKIIFNSIRDSVCVRYGKPTTSRPIAWTCHEAFRYRKQGE